jgi:hypothetical protein
MSHFLYLLIYNNRALLFEFFKDVRVYREIHTNNSKYSLVIAFETKVKNIFRVTAMFF